MPEPAAWPRDLVYDTATALATGRRERQEDAIVSDFSTGQPFGFVLLADGMGGHAAGDIASGLVVSEMSHLLKRHLASSMRAGPEVSVILREATIQANDALRGQFIAHPEARGMGATLLAPVVIGDWLCWISVGDSPLYLFRDGALGRLNDNHALGAQIGYLVASGQMTREDALAYPDQSCLTSVLTGDTIAQIDCPDTPVRLRHGDILLVASDGLQFLPDETICAVLRFARTRQASDIVKTLMMEIDRLDHPEQDNIALCVIKATDPTHDTPRPLGRPARSSSITILARITRKTGGEPPCPKTEAGV